jgi:hypothetical protein
MKPLAGVLLLSALFFHCSQNRVLYLNFTEKFEGQTQLILASQTMNVEFTEDISKRLLGLFPSNAKVKVVSNVTFDFYLDFQKEGYEAVLDKQAKSLQFEAPPIRVKKPVINASTVSYPETGLLVNEPQEAVQILESLTDRFIDEGILLLSDEKVMAKCTEKLQDYLLGLVTNLGHDVKQIEITYREEE